MGLLGFLVYPQTVPSVRLSWEPSILEPVVGEIHSDFLTVCAENTYSPHEDISSVSAAEPTEPKL